jgi:hypothetical protein
MNVPATGGADTKETISGNNKNETKQVAYKKTVHENIKVEGMASPRSDWQMVCHPADCGRDAIRDKNVFDATMNAVIIYDTFDFAAKANAMLERAAHQTDETTHWSVKPWRVDMLKLPPAAEAALADAAEAHLILLAVRQVQSLLPCAREPDPRELLGTPRRRGRQSEHDLPRWPRGRPCARLGTGQTISRRTIQRR